MFDLGFIADIRYMLRKMPRARQAPVDAVLGHAVAARARARLRAHEQPRADPHRAGQDHRRQGAPARSTSRRWKRRSRCCIGLLRTAEATRTMVFVNTRRMADRLEEVLRANRINAQALSGDVPQNKRLRYIKEFHSGELAVLIATDVASRGLHIPDVSHVVQLRPAAGLRRLRASHRPHRARRRRGRCDQLRLRGLRDLPARHRELHRPQDSGGERRNRSCSRPTWCSRVTSRAKMRRPVAVAAVVVVAGPWGPAAQQRRRTAWTDRAADAASRYAISATAPTCAKPARRFAWWPARIRRASRR